MKRSTLLASIGFAAQNLILAPVALGHGDLVSRNGGIAVASGEMTIEFVIAPRKVSVYLNDHGDAVSVERAQGTLVVGSTAVEDRAFPMRVGPDGGFEAVAVSPKRGDRVKFFAKMPDGQVHVAQIAAP